MKYAREGPKRKPVELRVLDWKEMYEPISEDKLKAQGARCMDCGVPFCQGNTGCPVVNLIPDWNDLVYRGRWKDALKALHTTNNFPEFTGRLCPAPCEGACVLGINEDPVSIRIIEWNIIDRGFNEGYVEPMLPVIKTGKTVAIVGSGPAGMAAAQQFARAGHRVTLFEKSDRIGGLLRYGIPDFKMEKWVIDRRLEQMKAEGVEFKTGVTIGKDITGEQLRKQFDAVGLTMGAEQARELPIPGRELKGVHLAMEYLTQQNKRTAGISVTDEPITAKGKRVVIIGGGDTGSDCLGTTHRQGCIEAHQFELLPEPPPTRADSTPWPLWPMQLRTSHAHEEGCDRQWSISTTKFTGHNGQVTKLHGNQGEVRERQVHADSQQRLRNGCGSRVARHGLHRPGEEWPPRQPRREVRSARRGVSGRTFHDQPRRRLCRRRHQTRRLAHRLGHRRRAKDGGGDRSVFARWKIGEVGV